MKFSKTYSPQVILKVCHKIKHLYKKINSESAMVLGWGKNVRFKIEWPSGGTRNKLSLKIGLLYSK